MDLLIHSYILGFKVPEGVGFMKQKRFLQILVSTIAGFILLLSLLIVVLPYQSVSESERRSLAKFPQLRVDAIGTGSFMEDLEVYLQDHFPFRENFRNLKAIVTYYGMGQKENHEIYLVQDGTKKSAVKIEAAYRKESLQYATDRFAYLYNTYLQNQAKGIYMVAIPDKHYYGAAYSKKPQMDYEKLFQQIEENMPYAKRIPIEDQLTLSHFYTTDSHWRQESLADLSSYLLKEMGKVGGQTYDSYFATDHFKGVYAGQLAIPMQADSIFYLENDILKSLDVYDYETNQEIALYDLEKIKERDPYELFMGGNKSLLRIQNNCAENQDKLVVFRDSFGSSLIPLLCAEYQEIWAVDIRYISPVILKNYINFQDADVLFLYSTSVLNHSETMK